MTTLVPLWIGGTGVDATASAVTFNNGVIVDDINLDGKVVTITGSASDTFTITSGTHGATTLATVDAAAAAGHITVAPDGYIMLNPSVNGTYFQLGGTSYGLAGTNGSVTQFLLRSMVSDGDLIIQGNDGGATINALTFDMSAAGAATFNSTLTSGNIEIANPGVGNPSVINFDKTNDTAQIRVTEYSSDSTAFNFFMSDNPTGTADYFQWLIASWKGDGADWIPLRFSDWDLRIVSDDIDMYGDLYVRPTQYFGGNQVEGTNGYSGGGLPGQYTKFSVDGSLDISINVSGYTNASPVLYTIIIDGTGSPNTFKWGNSARSGTMVASTVAITGSAQTLNNGVTITWDGTTGGAIGDEYQFTVVPGGTITGSGLLTTGGNIVIPDAGNIGSASDTDAIAISSGGVVTFSQAPVFPDGSINIADLDIDGGTDIGEAIVDADLFIIDNGAGGTNRKTAASRLKTYISAGSTVALDDITTGDAAATLATSAGNITIDAQGNDTDIIIKGTDGGVDTTFLTFDGSEARATFGTNVKVPSYVWLNGDDTVALYFGASAEISISHVHDTGLTFKNAIADTDNRPFILQLKSEEDAIVEDDVIASIEFAAGDNSGTDAATIAAGIHAIAEGEFTASANPTKLVFTTGVSESAGASATAKMTLSKDGLLTIADDFIIKDGGTIGSATTAGAITIASGGGVTFSNAVTAAALTVDDINLNTKIITMTGSTNDTAVFTVGTNGTLSIVTTDTAAAAANIQITADGTAELAGTTVTLNSSNTIEINADNATTFFKDGSTAIAAVAGTPQAPGVVQNAGFVPVGSILAHGSTTVPTGWLDATAGAAVSRTTYSVLFAVLSTAYGAGDGSTTFNVPALGDRMIMGKGTNNGTVGASSTAASASFVVATASGSASLTKSTTTFASSAKDSATAVGLTNVTAGGHTHNVTMPAQVCMYIIKA